MESRQSQRAERARVLLVEDNPADAHLARIALRTYGSEIGEVDEAASLADAIGVLSHTHVDIALLDLGLPDAWGLDALDGLRTAAPALPIIVLTGAEDRHLGIEAIRRGAEDYLEKSRVSEESLGRAIRYSIERSRVHRAERFLSAAARVLGSSLDLDRSLELLASLSASELADCCAIDLVGDDGAVEKRIASRREKGASPAARAANPHALPPGLELIAREGSRYRPALHRRRENGDGGEPHGPSMPPGVRSLMALPLMAKGELLGVLVLAARVREFAPDDLALGERFADLAAATISNARLYQAATEATRTRERVLGVVAHDLRNPLGTIALATDVLLDVKMDEQQKAHQLHLIRRTADRMNRLIEDLLDISRIQNGRLRLDVEYHRPGDLIREAVESQMALAASRRLDLHSDVRTEHPVLADTPRLLRVLANLIGNAIKFTPAGGEVVVGVEEAGACIDFSVRDTGPGIPAEDIPLMFRPFWQGREQSGEGVGLGLSIAQGIVEAHGGRIRAESELGSGTRITFSLPMAPDRRSRQWGDHPLEALRCDGSLAELPIDSPTV